MFGYGSGVRSRFAATAGGILAGVLGLLGGKMLYDRGALNGLIDKFNESSLGDIITLAYGGESGDDADGIGAALGACESVDEVRSYLQAIDNPDEDDLACGVIVYQVDAKDAVTKLASTLDDDAQALQQLGDVQESEDGSESTGDDGTHDAREKVANAAQRLSTLSHAFLDEPDLFASRTSLSTIRQASGDFSDLVGACYDFDDATSNVEDMGLSDDERNAVEAVRSSADALRDAAEKSKADLGFK